MVYVETVQAVIIVGINDTIAIQKCRDNGKERAAGKEYIGEDKGAPSVFGGTCQVHGVVALDKGRIVRRYRLVCGLGRIV